ncbi:MAG: chalcone isomerase family protein [Candidatus Omnitrophota bacterium]
MTGFKNMGWTILISSFLFVSTVPDVCHALQISQEKFKDEYKEDKIEMVIMGAALKRFSVFKAVAVAFYLEKGIKEDDILKDIPKRIEVASLQKISKEEFIKETLSGMQDNLEAGIYKSLEDKIQQLTGWYKDLEPGDRYTFTYKPGVGTQVEFNGVKQGVVSGEDFAFGLFSIYIGAKPADNRAKQKLLGRLDLYQK